MSGLYIHIPFCRQACHYCDFHFSTNLNQKAIMVDSICTEIAITKEYLNKKPLESIYFGGGTPSLLSSKELSKIIETIHKNFELLADIEITFEANPDDINTAFISNLKSNGINRLSIGLQSFNDSTLKYLNRVHDSSQSLRCVKDVQDGGITNISIDLIYGIPSIDHGIWEKDLQKATDLDVDHISSYCLTIEPKTVFGKWLKKGMFVPAEEDFSATQFEMLVKHLEANKYQQYEISNFCRGEKMARHNSNYWLSKSYLGVGPGAHSFDGISRQYNLANNTKYIKAISEGKLLYEKEDLTEKMKINEYIMTSIRTIWGCSLAHLRLFQAFDQKVFEERISRYIPKDLVFYENDHLKLTLKGKLLADEITHKLFL